MSPQPEPLFPEQEIARRVAQIGKEVTDAYAGREVCVIGLMKSCLVFMGDLIRHIDLDLTCHFLRVSSLLEEDKSTPQGSFRTDIVYSAEIPYTGRDVLLLDDIVDTGITLSFLLDQIRAAEPRMLKVCTLIDKPGVRKVGVRPDWAAFTVPDDPDRFIVGYGLDYQERYRGLPWLGTIPRPAASPAAGRAVPPGDGG